MSNRTYIIVATLTVIAAELIVCYWADVRTNKPTPDQRYGCTVAQQAPNGECK